MRAQNIALLLPALVALLLINGCSGSFAYRTDLPHNLAVTSKTESVTTSLAIYSVERDCSTTYAGSVELDNRRIELGIATGRPAYLVVNFTSSSFWYCSCIGFPTWTR